MRGGLEGGGKESEKIKSGYKIFFFVMARRPTSPSLAPKRRGRGGGGGKKKKKKKNKKGAKTVTFIVKTEKSVKKGVFSAPAGYRQGGSPGGGPHK